MGARGDPSRRPAVPRGPDPPGKPRTVPRRRRRVRVDVERPRRKTRVDRADVGTGQGRRRGAHLTGRELTRRGEERQRG